MMAGVLKIEYVYRMDTLSSDYVSCLNIYSISLSNYVSCLNTYSIQICVLSECVSWEHTCFA